MPADIEVVERETVVTEDMIRRACNAYGTSQGSCEFEWMRAALAAALLARSRSESEAS